MSQPSVDDFNSDDLVSEISGIEDSGQGQTQTESVQPDTTQNATPQEPQQIADNPAWKPYLDKFDPSIHDKVKEVLADQDAKIQRRLERDADLRKNYGQLAEQGVDPRIVNAGVQLFQNLNNNPQAFYAKLGESLGISAQQAKQLVDQQDDPDEEEIDPRTAHMQQEVEQMKQYLAQQQEFQQQQVYQQQVQQEEQKLDQDLQGLKTQYSLTDTDLQGVLQRTLFLTQNNPAATVHDGLQMLLQERQNWERSRQTNNAPNVLSGNGASAVAPTQAFVDKSDADQRAEMVEILKGLS